MEMFIQGAVCWDFVEILINFINIASVINSYFPSGSTSLAFSIISGNISIPITSKPSFFKNLVDLSAPKPKSSALHFLSGSEIISGKPGNPDSNWSRTKHTVSSHELLNCFLLHLEFNF